MDKYMSKKYTAREKGHRFADGESVRLEGVWGRVSLPQRHLSRSEKNFFSNPIFCYLVVFTEFFINRANILQKNLHYLKNFLFFRLTLLLRVLSLRLSVSHMMGL
jgi:hypothetical protein